jgi:peptidyl-prolyl cis-trans isomerase A (cyclophilin A)
MPTATFRTNVGAFTVELMPEQAPKAVENFVGLATGRRSGAMRDGEREGGTFARRHVFHRVSGLRMIRRRPTGTGTGGPNTDSKRGSPNGPRSTEPVVWPSQFGPNTAVAVLHHVAETPLLDGRHTIFGQVVEGYDIVERIATVPTGTQDRPVDDVVIDRVTIDE